MKRIQKMIAAVFTIAVVVAGAVKPAWADRFTMADIAMIEYRSGVQEEPAGSGTVKYNDWYYGKSNSNNPEENSWDAVFTCWCAEQLGYINRGCFPETDSTAELFDWFVENGYRMYSVGDYLSSEGTVIRPGDIIFVLSAETDPELKVGIVTFTNANEVGYVMGDVDGAVQHLKKELSYQGKSIVFFPVIPSESDNYLEIVEFLSAKMSLNPAAICGIVANIIYESNGMPTALGDNGTSYGICQWHDDRWQQLINYCNAAGYDWTSLDGQLMFLWYDLNTLFPDLKDLLIACPDSMDGAYKAGYAFCLSYESPQDTSTKAEIRAAEAMYNVYSALYG